MPSASIQSSAHKRTAPSVSSSDLASVVLPEPGKPHTMMSRPPVELDIEMIRNAFRRKTSLGAVLVGPPLAFQPTAAHCRARRRRLQTLDGPLLYQQIGRA